MYTNGLVQAGEKLMLQEGSRVVMVLCATSDSQGVYGLVTNLGSLVVRTLFQPLEEAAFLAFSQPHVPTDDPGSSYPHGHMVSGGSKAPETSGLSAEGSFPPGALHSSAVDGGSGPLQRAVSDKAGHERQQRALLSALMKVALLAGMNLHLLGMFLHCSMTDQALRHGCPCCCTVKR